MIVLLKLSEVIIMLLGVVAFLWQSSWASYTLLFLLSLQSAMFTPPKYSIIPELVKQEHISKANGLITSFTYLGVIIGTFLASFLTQVTNKNFPLAAGVARPTHQPAARGGSPAGRTPRRHAWQEGQSAPKSKQL